MKAIIKKGIFSIAAMLVCLACDPIEDESLRDDHYKNPGTPITKAELQAAISVTQPYPNTNEDVRGDQYLVLKNERTDVGGVWHIWWGDGRHKTSGKDRDTIICTENTVHSVYYVGISGGTVVKTDSIYATVTNVFDEWDGLLTNAKDKTDKAAKKAWRFREVSWGSICNMGAHGGWRPANGMNPETKNTWWNNHVYADAGDQQMVFEYDGMKFKTYNASGVQTNEGVFYFSHDKPDRDAEGTLGTTIKTIGSNWDDCGQVASGNNLFWILRLEKEYLTIFHPFNYTNPVDWVDYGWYAYFEAVSE